MKPKEYEVIFKFTVAPTVPFPSALNWNAEPIGELIRCKDCKLNPERMLVGCPMAGSMSRNDESFCAWAKPKESE